AKVARNSYFQLNHGKSIKWTGAASVYGLTIGASTQYDSDHQQRLTAGSKPLAHDIWGSKGPISGSPGMFMSW
ncbi:hypothetical protein, partial [Streptomyces sp. NPDC127574]